MGLQIVRSLVFTRNTAFPFIDNISSLFLFFFLGKPCAVDHYQNEVAQSSCKACVGCGKGQYTTCDGSTTQCTACSDGTFSNISAEAGIATSCKQCQSCGNGHFYETCSKSGDGNGCQPCEAGRYSTSSNHKLATCVKCPVGYSTDGTAANVQCTECEEGKTLKHHPTLKCLFFFRPLCPFEFSMLTILWCVLFLWLLFFAGKYSDDDVVGGSCIACPTGYVSTTTSLCKAIDQKKYRPDPNVEKTKYCTAGHYCDGMNMLPCPPGNNTCTANATNTIPTTADPTTLPSLPSLPSLLRLRLQLLRLRLL